MDHCHVCCCVGQQTTSGSTENWLIVGQEGEGNQLIEQGQEEEHGGELFDEQEEELENLPGTDEPHDVPEGLQGVQQTDQQQQHGHGGHRWCPDPNELAAAQGLVGHHHHSVNRTAELPDLRGRLNAAALERERQIDEEVAHEVEADIIGLRRQREAQRLVSDGDGGTLLMRNRRAEEGLNATDGNRFNAFLRRQLDKP